MDTTVTNVSSTSTAASDTDPSSTSTHDLPPAGMRDARADEVNDPAVRRLVQAATRRHARLTGLGLTSAVIAAGAGVIASAALRGKDMSPTPAIIIGIVLVVGIIAVFSLRGWMGQPPRYAFIGTLDDADRREAHRNIQAVTPSPRADLRYAERQYATWAAETGPRAPFVIALAVAVVAIYAWMYSGWQLLILIPFVGYVAWSSGHAVLAWRHRKEAAAYLAAV